MSPDTLTQTPSPTAGSTQQERRHSARNPWAIVARREIIARLTDRAFLVGTLLTLVLITGFLGLQAVLGNRTQEFTVATLPANAAFTQSVADGADATDDKLTITTTEVADAAAAEAALTEGTADAWLHEVDGVWTLTGNTDVDSGLASALGTQVRGQVVAENAAAAGTTPAAIEAGSLLATSQLQGDADQRVFAQVVGFALAFLFYFASISFGMTLAGSVVEEKSSRIVEIITTKIPVRQLLAGKVLGNTALALGQMALFTGIGLIGLTFTEYSSYVPSLTGAIAWFIVFFVVGFLLIACLWAVAGALASRSEDLQQTSMPVTMGMVAVFFSTFLAKGTWLVALSYVPPFSAILMPMRLVEGTASWWEPIVSIVILLLSAAVVVMGAERVYRRSLLQTQGRLSVRQAWTAAE
ncbi:MAG: ABC transporter permease [Phycicoccus sp.]|nr:ABC transporter permease [Phycicoccus sp.]